MAFVSQGFEDSECIAAAALALKFLCEFCGPMLVDYLSQLHPFYVTATANGSSIPPHECRELATAIAHVLSAVPVGEMLKTLQMFTLPVAQRLHAIVSTGKPRSEEIEVATVKECQDLLDQLAIFLKFVDPKVKKKSELKSGKTHLILLFYLEKVEIGQSNPAVQLLQDLWPVLESLFTLFGDGPIANSVSRILNYAMDNLKGHLAPLLPQIISKAVEMYDCHGQSSYVWVVKKGVEIYAKEDNGLGKEMIPIIEKVTAISIRGFQKCGSLDDVPEGM